MERIKELEELIVELKKEIKSLKNKIRCRNNYNKNREIRKQGAKNYRDNNKEKVKEGEKKRSKNLNRQIYSRICKWKERGLICDDYMEIHNRYLNTSNCDICNVLLTSSKPRSNTTKCLDHSHITGEFRNILCNLCNLRRGENNF